MATTIPITCPYCEAENNTSSHFCLVCGKPILSPKNTASNAKGSLHKNYLIGNNTFAPGDQGGTTGTTDAFGSYSALLSSETTEQFLTTHSMNAFNTTDAFSTISPLTPYQQGFSGMTSAQSLSSPLSRELLQQTLQKLQAPTVKISRYFPANLPDKQKKLEVWQQQITRAQYCLDFINDPLVQQPELQRAFDQLHTLAEAVKALDFTREYTVKLIGPAGAGKSTLLNALLGQDILPTGFGTAVTGIRTRIRLCDQQQEEELRIHFLTQQAFDQLFAETETRKNREMAERAVRAKTADPTAEPAEKEEDGPFTKEWKRLHYLKETPVDKATGMTYVAKYVGRNEPLIFSRKQWRAETRKFIVEPLSENDPYFIRLVDSVTFTLRANEDSLLPEGSVWVDLPGGSAGQVHHDAILEQELQQLDSVILVVGGPRYDNEGARKIFEKVYQSVYKNRSAEVAARMIFIAATRWDEIKTDHDLNSAEAGMYALLNKLPPSYQDLHKHITNNDYAFYPLRAFDARMARLGMRTAKLDLKYELLDAEQQREALTYKGHVAAVYDKLQALNGTLPATAAQDFEKLPHAEMYVFSGLPELTHDVQNFLTEQRYAVQLQHAKEQLNRAFQYIEDVCWSYLNQHQFFGRDIQKLKKETQKREGGLKRRRVERLQELIAEMHVSWQQALKGYDNASHKGPRYNSFYLSLQEAYTKAIEHIYRRIDNKDFDEHIDVAQATFHMTITEKEEFTDVYGKRLRSALRLSLGRVLEQRMQGQPADVLADMFLASIEKEGPGTGGALDIQRITFGENSEEITEIVNAYEKLLEDVRTTAREVCHYITMSEFVDEKHELAKEHPLINQLYDLGTIIAIEAEKQVQADDDIKTPEYILASAREIIKEMTLALSAGLVESSYRRILYIYRSELSKLEHFDVYDMARTEATPITEAGDFNKLVNGLFSSMLSLLDTSPTLGSSIDNEITTQEIDFDAWADFIDLIRKQKRSA